MEHNKDLHPKQSREEWKNDSRQKRDGERRILRPTADEKAAIKALHTRRRKAPRVKAAVELGRGAHYPRSPISGAWPGCAHARTLGTGKWTSLASF